MFLIVIKTPLQNKMVISDMKYLLYGDLQFFKTGNYKDRETEKSRNRSHFLHLRNKHL